MNARPSPYRRPTRPEQLHPQPSDIAEVFGIRWRELETIATRLGRMTKMRLDKLFTAAFVLLLGGAGGAAFGLIPFLAAEPQPDETSKLIYIGLIIITVLVAIIFGVASLAVKGERDDSVEAICEDLNSLLKPYREQVLRTERRRERGAL